MSLVNNTLGAFGISKTGILAGALEMVGVPSKAAHAVGLAAELARGLTKDGFDFNKVNKGAVARHALKAFGVNSPTATLALTAALSLAPKGFLSGTAPVAGALGGAAIAGTAMGGLSKMQLGIGALLMGIAGAGGGDRIAGLATAGALATGAGAATSGGFGVAAAAAGLNPTQIAGSAPRFLFGNRTSEFRLATGMTRASGGPGSMLANLPLGAFFEDIIAAFMIDIVKDQQEKIGNRMKAIQEKTDKAAKIENQATSQGLSAAETAKNLKQAGIEGNSESRNIEFEIIKNEIQKMTQMQQALSNILNTQHEQAMTAIRHIKG